MELGGGFALNLNIPETQPQDVQGPSMVRYSATCVYFFFGKRKASWKAQISASRYYLSYLSKCKWIYLCIANNPSSKNNLIIHFPALSRPELIICHWKETKKHQVSTWSTSPSSSLGRDPLRVLQWKGVEMSGGINHQLFLKDNQWLIPIHFVLEKIAFWCNCSFAIENQTIFVSSTEEKRWIPQDIPVPRRFGSCFQVVLPELCFAPSLWTSWFAHRIFAETFLLPVPSVGRVYGISWEGLTAKHLEIYLPRKVTAPTTSKKIMTLVETNHFFCLIATSQLHLEMCCQEIQSDIEDAIAKYNEATSRLAEAEKNKAQADQVPWHGEAKPWMGVHGWWWKIASTDLQFEPPVFVLVGMTFLFELPGVETWEVWTPPVWNCMIFQMWQMEWVPVVVDPFGGLGKLLGGDLEEFRVETPHVSDAVLATK